MRVGVKPRARLWAGGSEAAERLGVWPSLASMQGGAPVSGWRMLNASPSSSAPGRCSGAAGISLFCMLRMRPAPTASRNAACSCAGTCACAAPLRDRTLSSHCDSTARLRW
jgi:hypothetical protein